MTLKNQACPKVNPNKAHAIYRTFHEIIFPSLLLLREADRAWTFYTHAHLLILSLAYLNSDFCEEEERWVFNGSLLGSDFIYVTRDCPSVCHDCSPFGICTVLKRERWLSGLLHSFTSCSTLKFRIIVVISLTLLLSTIAVVVVVGIPPGWWHCMDDVIVQLDKGFAAVL